MNTTSKLIQLPAGTSGYSPKRKKATIPYSEIESFVTTFCAQNTLKLEFDASLQRYQDFSYELFIVGLEGNNQQFGLLVNKNAKVFAIAKFHERVHFSDKDFGVTPIPDNNYCNQEDLPGFAYLDINHFTFLSADFLSQKVDGDIPESAFIVEDLYNEEFAEFSYWEPKCMADIVFNNWKK